MVQYLLGPIWTPAPAATEPPQSGWWWEEGDTWVLLHRSPDLLPHPSFAGLALACPRASSAQRNRQAPEAYLGLCNQTRVWGHVLILKGFLISRLDPRRPLGPTGGEPIASTLKVQGWRLTKCVHNPGSGVGSTSTQSQDITHCFGDSVSGGPGWP